MRRLFALLLLCAMVLTGIIAAAPPDPSQPVPISPAPFQPFTYTVPLQPATWEEVQTLYSPQASPADDQCNNAPSLNLSLPADGGQAVVNSYTESASDPQLSCMWGDPPSQKGYRTAWYKVVPPTGGLLVIEAIPNAEYQDNYDTVIAIHTGTCSVLQMLACNDDSNGFLSKTTALVQQGITYYVEIVDWQFGVNGTARLNVLAYITQADNYWQQAGDLPEPLSRHLALPVGSDFYILGGMLANGASPERTPALRKYNTLNGTWSNLATMPAIPSSCLDTFGYAATDGVVLDGKIYIPSGFTGNNNTYCGIHLVYDIVTNSWSTATSAPWPQPLGWIQATPYFDPPSINGYFVTGGLTGAPFTVNANPSGELYLFQKGNPPTPDSWTTFEPMTKPRYGHAAAVLGDKVCVVGGINVNSQVIPDGECFDLLFEEWNTIPPLKVPRFNAGSAVGPDGRWYVFGGTAPNLTSVAPTEMYDPATNTWSLLDTRYNLGTTNGVDRPARSWVRGDFIGQTLWAFGGEQDIGVTSGGLPLDLIEKLTFGVTLPAQNFFPILSASPPSGEPNDTFNLAQNIAVNQTLAYNFANGDDYYDVYRFYQDNTVATRFYLQNIPNEANYDMLVYNSNKTLLGSGHDIGTNNEYLDLTLNPGFYYVMIVRAYPLNTPPPTANYTLRVEN